MKTLRIVLALCFAWTAFAATTRNDDSCDIGVVPAATLLLPYFEVDLEDPSGETTVFTITNVTNADRIARVTLWTDYAFPVVTFNIQLTGYGVQSMNLYDVIARGVIGPQTSVARGRYSKPNPSNTCGELPRTLPPAYLTLMENAFLEGIAPDNENSPIPFCYNIGGEHLNAIGYATIDVVRNCSTNNALAEQYWTEDIAFDNVLIGDYQQVHSAKDFAQGAPLVHIRAIPEGGGATSLPRTFYSRFTNLDARQPLPSVFAARWIEGSELVIWRETVTGKNGICSTLDDNVAIFREIVTFDDAENAFDIPPICTCDPTSPLPPTLPATSRTRVSDHSLYPHVTNGASSGWVYLNLGDDKGDVRASSNWVVVSMRAEGRYSVAMDAAALGNGCSAPAPVSEASRGTAIIGPRP